MRSKNLNISANSNSSIVNDSKTDHCLINSKLCRLVEQYPCMYDRSHPHYLKKDVVEQAWIEIATEMNDSSKFKICYYLYYELRFVLFFLSKL